MSEEITNEDLILQKLGRLTTTLSNVESNTEYLSEIKDHLKEIRSLLEEFMSLKRHQ
jgi:GTP1/Obg family GTP-binding protein